MPRSNHCLAFDVYHPHNMMTFTLYVYEQHAVVFAVFFQLHPNCLNLSLSCYQLLFFLFVLLFLCDFLSCLFSLLCSIPLKHVKYIHDCPVHGQESYFQLFNIINKTAVSILAWVLCKCARVSSDLICRCRTRRVRV